jgi:hypothetical protein
MSYSINYNQSGSDIHLANKPNKHEDKCILPDWNAGQRNGVITDLIPTKL